jgi:predicted RNA-binding Zn ribbon-like protein
MSTHPLDSTGLALPDGNWPPGKEAPGALEVLRRFCNSSNPENGAERFRDADQLDAWLSGEGIAAIRAGPAGLGRVLRFRAQVRTLAVANRDGRRDVATFESLVAGIGGGSLRLVAEQRGLALARRGHGVSALLAELASTIVIAQADGTWPRLKACTNDHCRWMYYDHSKNSNGAWCSMKACGQRHKAREYRARRATLDLSPG